MAMSFESLLAHSEAYFSKSELVTLSHSVFALVDTFVLRPIPVF